MFIPFYEEWRMSNPIDGGALRLNPSVGGNAPAADSAPAYNTEELLDRYFAELSSLDERAADLVAQRAELVRCMIQCCDDLGSKLDLARQKAEAKTPPPMLTS
jgi:hypothetical protein